MIKATELMIGDLINGFGVVRRVTSIIGLERPEDDGLLTTMVPGCEFPDGNLSFRPCYAQPIPLTAEILEKNGFEMESNGNYWFSDEDEGLEITFFPKEENYTNGCYDYVDIYKGCLSIIELPVRFVHELQHALRLCGVEKEITI